MCQLLKLQDQGAPKIYCESKMGPDSTWSFYVSLWQLDFNLYARASCKIFNFRETNMTATETTECESQGNKGFGEDLQGFHKKRQK